jgi:hypothetical protein
MYDIPAQFDGIWLGIAGLCTLYIGISLWYYPYIIVDKGAGFIRSLCTSYRLSGGIKAFMLIQFLYGIVGSGIIGITHFLPKMVGMVILSISAVILLLLWSLHWTYVYRRLS